MDDGPCKAHMPRYFFNILTQQCEEFIYGGCGGNQNRFDTIDECKEQCTAGRFVEQVTQETLPEIVSKWLGNSKHNKHIHTHKHTG